MAKQARRRELRELIEVATLDSDSDSSLIVAAAEEELNQPVMEVIPRIRFMPERHSNSWFIEHTRFTYTHIVLIKELLRCPEEYVLDNLSRVNSTEALIISLCRLAFPNRLTDHVKVFGRSSSMISRIFNSFILDIHERSKSVLETINNPSYDFEYLSSVTRQQCPLNGCIGFIDGTVRYMCRPGTNQEIVYNGHKRKHALKFQSVLLANGMIVLHGPYEGRRHDSFLFRESGVAHQLRQLPHRQDGSRYVLYGDPAYALQEQVICPYPQGRNVNADHQMFNEAMSSVRQSVEYGFGKVTQYFSYIDFDKQLKMLLSPIGAYYRVAVLFTNIHTCLYGSAYTSLLNTSAPTLAEYLIPM